MKKKEIMTCADMKEYQKRILLDTVDIRDTLEGNQRYVQTVLINAAIILLELQQKKWDYVLVKEQISMLAHELLDVVDY